MRDFFGKLIFEKNQFEIFFCTKVPERLYCGANLQRKVIFESTSFFLFFHLPHLSTTLKYKNKNKKVNRSDVWLNISLNFSTFFTGIFLSERSKRVLLDPIINRKMMFGAKSLI